ncbi:MAG: 50S ribosomal protein L18 [Chloroflexota bacterium]|nr:50S ribosomal protein L18 [Chloroflexota bacterium]
MVSSRSRKRHIRHLRVRKKISGSSDVPRLSVFRSNKNIYVQLINDVTRETLVSCDNKDKEVVSTKVEKDVSSKSLEAYKVGFVFAERCKKIGIKKLVFDRGGYKYHGRLKALAEGARDNGMEF